MKSTVLLVMCGRRVEKLGGQDRRWLKVAKLISEACSARILINESYAALAKKTEIPLPNEMDVVSEKRNKYVAYLWLNLVIFFRAFRCEKIHYCGNALEMTPSAVLIWILLRKNITFSFNGVSIDYLKETGQKKAVMLLRVMNCIAYRIEVLNKTVVSENFFNPKKIRLSNAMYAGPETLVSAIEDSKKIVFAGHLYAAKGAYLLMRIVETCPDLKFRFVIYGERPSDADLNVNEWIAKISSYANVSFMNHANDMSEAYSDASVVLSLQTISNYPSQVVMEGLVQGAAVVIVKSGDSERFGDGPGIFYVPAEFDSYAYWQAISLASECSASKRILISSAALENFGAGTYVRNFMNNMGIAANANGLCN